MTVLQYLMSLRPALPYGTTVPPAPMSGGEIRRLCKSGAILINGETVSDAEPMDFPVFSLVFYPRGKRRTTLV